MTAEYRLLASSLERLAQASSGPDALVQAEVIGDLFAMHVGKGNDLLLPPLRADEAVHLAQLLVEMHRLRSCQVRHPHRGGRLGRRRRVDAGFAASRGSRRAGRGWAWGEGLSTRGRGIGGAAVAEAEAGGAGDRRPPPPRPFGDGRTRHAGSRTEEAENVEILDVRDLAPAQRHEAIFTAYGSLEPGTGFVLVNDYDPKPLYYQFEAEHEGGSPGRLRGRPGCSAPTPSSHPHCSPSRLHRDHTAPAKPGG